MFLNNYAINATDLRDLRGSFLSGLSGQPYAQRHWEASLSRGLPDSIVWGHRCIAVIEYIPLLGAVAAIIERVVAAIFAPPTSNAPRQTLKPLSNDDKQQLALKNPLQNELDQQALNHITRKDVSVLQNETTVQVTSSVGDDW